MSHRLVLVRHGQTEWSATGRHTGLTDVDLTTDGERQARALAPFLARYRDCTAWSSPLTRARRTAELAGLRDVQVDEDLLEWDYGAYEGLTTPQIRDQGAGPDWTVFADGVLPGDTPGESLQQVTARARRVLAACWVDADPTFGARLILSAGSVSLLGDEHDVPGIVSWNVQPTGDQQRAAQ
jgi:probable phosphoglycerate mutase